MSRRNQKSRRRTYGRRQHEVRERRIPGTPGETDPWARDSTWDDLSATDSNDDNGAADSGRFGSYAR